MSRKSNKTAIGVFVVGAMVLLVIGISVFSSGLLFKKVDKYVLFCYPQRQGTVIVVTERNRSSLTSFFPP